MKTNILRIVTLLLVINCGNVVYAQKRTLSLTDALELAKQGNKALQVQALEELKVKEMTRETRGALLPSISGNVGYSYYFDRQAIFLPGSFAGTDKSVQDIAVGGKNRPSASSTRCVENRDAARCADGPMSGRNASTATSESQHSERRAGKSLPGRGTTSVVPGGPS